jgi:hypothetical protein
MDDLLVRELVETDQVSARSIAISSASGRWYVPVVERLATVAALDVYRPVRPSRIVAWHGARALARTGLFGVLGRSRSGVARAFLADLERAFGRGDLRASAWFPPEGDRAVVCAVTTRGRVVGFAKIAWSEPARARLRAERRALALRERAGGCLAAPTVLDVDELCGIDALVLGPAGGAMGLAPWRFDGRRADALASLVGVERRALGELVHLELPRGEPWASLVDRATRALTPWMEVEVPVAFAHGDFTPWNVMNRGAGVVAVDWEDADPDGMPFWDAWHFAVQGASLAGAGSEDGLVRAAIGGAGGLRRGLERYARAAGVSPGLAGPILLVYLAVSPVTVGRHGDVDRPDRRVALRFRRSLLDRLLGAMT